MNFALIGPGILPIPPDGWGAVESLIWDYSLELDELGHTGIITNFIIEKNNGYIKKLNA
jgi:hypothetical protein